GGGGAGRQIRSICLRGPERDFLTASLKVRSRLLDSRSIDSSGSYYVGGRIVVTPCWRGLPNVVPAVAQPGRKPVPIRSLCRSRCPKSGFELRIAVAL